MNLQPGKCQTYPDMSRLYSTTLTINTQPLGMEITTSNNHHRSKYKSIIQFSANDHHVRCYSHQFSACRCCIPHIHHFPKVSSICPPVSQIFTGPPSSSPFSSDFSPKAPFPTPSPRHFAAAAAALSAAPPDAFGGRFLGIREKPI